MDDPSQWPRWIPGRLRGQPGGEYGVLARSEDGLHWQVVSREELLKPGEPGKFDEKALNHPALVLVDDELYLFYTGYNRANRRALGLATAHVNLGR